MAKKTQTTTNGKLSIAQMRDAIVAGKPIDFSNRKMEGDNK